ncbi:MAG: DsrE family protein [Oleispira sp.]|nr:DsrE family protein [Oleispira sp.]MBL4880918.1 DsrE family protein [Oleispira sp.]
MSHKLSFLLLLFPMLVAAQSPAIQPALHTQTVTVVAVADSSVQISKSQSLKLQADIELHTLTELKQLLEQAEGIANGKTEYNTEAPIAVVLHGEEIRAFLRTNYRLNKSLVDLAARLDAFNVIDVKVCRRWMGANGIMVNDLPSFVEPVPFGVAERNRLEAAGYAYF